MRSYNGREEPAGKLPLSAAESHSTWVLRSERGALLNALADRTPAARAWGARPRCRSDRGGSSWRPRCRRCASRARSARRPPARPARLAGRERVARPAGRRLSTNQHRASLGLVAADGRRHAHGLGGLEGAPHGAVRRTSRTTTRRRRSRASALHAHRSIAATPRTPRWGENIAYGQSSPTDVMTAWINSAGPSREPRQPVVPGDRRGRRRRRRRPHLLGAGLRQRRRRGGRPRRLRRPHRPLRPRRRLRRLRRRRRRPRLRRRPPPSPPDAGRRRRRRPRRRPRRRAGRRERQIGNADRARPATRPTPVRASSQARKRTAPGCTRPSRMRATPYTVRMSFGRVPRGDVGALGALPRAALRQALKGSGRRSPATSRRAPGRSRRARAASASCARVKVSGRHGVSLVRQRAA